MPPLPLSRRYRTAFVTGASTGLGFAFVEMLLGEGVEVWGTARDTARLAARKGFHPVALELGDGAAAERSFLTAWRAAGGFDIVINNAGFGVFGEFGRTDFGEWEAQLRIMLINTARLCHVALREFRTHGGGTLVNVSSLACEFPLPYQSAYNMAKAGLTALTESLAYEVKGTGVIVIDFRPGDHRTEFHHSIRRPEQKPAAAGDARLARAWKQFERMMRSGPAPARAAADLRRALQRRRSGTVRSGGFFQARLAPLLARLGSLELKRRVQEWYFGL